MVFKIGKIPIPLPKHGIFGFLLVGSQHFEPRPIVLAPAAVFIKKKEASRNKHISARFYL